MTPFQEEVKEMCQYLEITAKYEDARKVLRLIDSNGAIVHIVYEHDTFLSDHVLVWFDSKRDRSQLEIGIFDTIVGVNNHFKNIREYSCSYNYMVGSRQTAFFRCLQWVKDQHNEKPDWWDNPKPGMIFQNKKTCESFVLHNYNANYVLVSLVTGRSFQYMQDFLNHELFGKTTHEDWELM